MASGLEIPTYKAASQKTVQPRVGEKSKRAYLWGRLLLPSAHAWGLLLSGYPHHSGSLTLCLPAIAYKAENGRSPARDVCP